MHSNDVGPFGHFHGETISSIGGTYWIRGNNFLQQWGIPRQMRGGPISM